jgi:polysaccharide pyruvyl transferase WcaK-like protein
MPAQAAHVLPLSTSASAARNRLAAGHSFSPVLPRLVQPEDAIAALQEPRIGLMNAYSSRNLGDAAIMSSLASLVPGGRALAAIDEPNPIPLPGVVRGQSLDRCSKLISVGGDIFNNSRPWLVTRTFLKNISTLTRAGSSGMVFGQTIPSSCKGAGLIMLAAAMRRLGRVVVRDEQSYGLLRRYGVDARLSYDVAFVAEATDIAHRRGRNMLARCGLDPARAALISVRSFDALYPSDQAETERKLLALAEALRSRGHQPAILAQSDVNPADSDLAMAARLSAAMPGLPIIDCVNQQADPLSTLVGTLALANIVVGVRYHTTVLRLAAGRQAFNLYYSRKGQDLSDRLGIAGCHIDDFDADRHLGTIERTAGRLFDPKPIAAHVRESFSEGLGALQ